MNQSQTLQSNILLISFHICMLIFLLFDCSLIYSYIISGAFVRSFGYSLFHKHRRKQTISFPLLVFNMILSVESVVHLSLLYVQDVIFLYLWIFYPFFLFLFLYLKKTKNKSNNIFRDFLSRQETWERDNNNNNNITWK